MKHILLDIDGVMVSGASWKLLDMGEDDFPLFAKSAVDSLNKILEKTGARIMLTSSHKNRYSLRKWKEIFDKRGIRESYLGKIPSDISKLEDILAWVTNFEHILDFVIIDDDRMLNDLPKNVKSKLILTSPYIGLSETDATKAIEILNYEQSTTTSISF